MPSQPPTAFGAVLERVPSVGGQWASGTTTTPPKSPLGSLLSLLFLAALVGGGWYGYTYWYQPRAPLPEAVATYVDGAGVEYTSPVTGIAGNFAGAPVEVRLASGAPAAVYTGDDMTMLVVVLPAGATEAEAEAAARAYAPGGVLRTAIAPAGANVYAAVVGAADERAARAALDRFKASLRIPGGVTI